ncbi:hypothetical protein [Acinetobacter haemolyticus]|uniref:hypothetical protein n=1 Tax=Acinetobacter haemolyticus TaxID=29430 RepID=UPI0030090213
MATQQRMGTLEDLMNLQEVKQDKKSNPKMGTLDDLMTLQMNEKEVKDLGTQKPMQIKAVDAGKPSAAKSFILGAANKVGGGINQGASSFKDLGSSLINNAFGTNLKTDRYNEVTKQTKAVNDAYELSRSKAGQKGTDWWSVAGESAATLPAGAAGVGRTLLGTVLKSAGVGAGIGGAGFANDSRERLSNTIFGAAGGAAGGAIGKGAEKIVGKAINTVKGSIGANAKEVRELGRQHGVNLTAGDLSRSALLPKVDTTLEQIPFIGIGGFREAQQKQVKNVAENLSKKYEKLLNQTDYKDLGRIQKAAKSGDRRAMDVLSTIARANDDPNQVIQASAKIKQWRQSQASSMLYDDVAKIAGDATIVPDKSVSWLRNKSQQLASSMSPDPVIAREVSQILGRFDDPTIPKTFENLRMLRSDLGALASDLGEKGEKRAASAIGDLREAVSTDLDNFAKSQGGALKSAWNRADSYYRQVMEGRDKEIAKTISSARPDEILDAFIKRNKGDRAERFFKQLDPKGQAALKNVMIENAIEKATNPSTQVFSPAKFAQYFEAMDAPYGRVFKGNEKKSMDGLIKLMRHAERAGQYAENPPTGNRLAVFLGGGAAGTAIASATGEPITTGLAITSPLVLSSLTKTKIGQNLLMSAAELPPNSPKLANLFKMAQQLSVVTGATSSTD